MMLEGGCYCGGLRYKADGEAMAKGQCHCRECQYIAGGSPNLFMVMPEAGFTYTKGTPKEFSRKDIENPVTREFCPDCGTHIATRRPGMAAAVIKVGTLDDPSQFGRAHMAIFTIDKQEFHYIPHGIPSFERMPRR